MDLSATRLRRSPRAHVGALVMLATALFAPYAVAGPGFFIDDWFSLANGALDQWWMSAGSAQWRARPGAAAVYAVTFGLVGERPMVHFVFAAVLVTVASIVLYRVASRFLSRDVAFGVAAIWLVLPTHTSLEMWPSCLNIALALLLLLLGAERLTRSCPTRGGDALAGALFCIGTLSYEAIAPAAGVIAVLVALRRPPGERAQVLVPSLLGLAAAGTWMIVNWHPDKEGLDVSMHPSSLVSGHFGETITGGATWAELIIVFAVLALSVLAAATLVSEERRRAADWRHGLVIAGWLVILLGALPFVRYFYSPLGLGDRVLVVSSIGGAMVLVGVACLLERAHAAMAAIFLAIVLSVGIAQRISMAADYAVAADDGRRIRAFVEGEWPEPPTEQELVFGPEPIERRNIVAFYDVGSSIQLLYEDRAARARMTFVPSEFFAAPARWRVDIRKLSKLDDGRLGAADGPGTAP